MDAMSSECQQIRTTADTVEPEPTVTVRMEESGICPTGKALGAAPAVARAP